MAKVPNGLKKIAEDFNRPSRVHERCRQTTDRRLATDGRTGLAYSEREREFMFANFLKNQNQRCSEETVQSQSP